MKEIKYQAYVKNDIFEGIPASMFPVSSLLFTSDGILDRVGMWVGNAPRTLPLDYVTLRQYTGLKDKNGKEIYEGDILQSCEPELVCVVSFYEDCVQFRAVNNKSDIHIDPHDWDARDVIGNIYENPELFNK
jgi:hypothetical protein